MATGEVLHTVLQVAHIAEKILTELWRGLDGRRVREWRTTQWVEVGGEGCRWRWVARQIGGNHNKEKAACKRQDRQQIWVDADECIHEEEGECLGWLLPGEESNESVLEDKCYADTRVEASKVRRHGWYTEVWPLDIRT